MVIIIRLFLIGVLTLESVTQYFSPEKIHLLIIALLPAIFWLSFFLLEERKEKRQPIINIIYMITMGVLAALTALDLQVGVQDLLGENFSKVSATTVIGFAFIEEFLKFIFVYFAIRKSKFFTEPIDGMLDMIMGALGFAAFENILFIIHAPDVISISIFRFIGAILLHAIASGLVGYYLIRKNVVFGLILAVLLHSAFNLIVLYSDYGVLLAPFLLIIAAFFLFRDFDILKKR